MDDLFKAPIKSILMFTLASNFFKTFVSCILAFKKGKARPLDNNFIEALPAIETLIGI